MAAPEKQRDRQPRAHWNHQQSDSHTHGHLGDGRARDPGGHRLEERHPVFFHLVQQQERGQRQPVRQADGVPRGPGRRQEPQGEASGIPDQEQARVQGTQVDVPQQRGYQGECGGRQDQRRAFSYFFHLLPPLI